MHHTMLTAENLRGLPSKQLHTIEPHFSHVRERPPGPSMVGWGGWSVFIRFGPVIGLHFFKKPTSRISSLMDPCMRWRPALSGRPMGGQYHLRMRM